MNLRHGFLLEDVTFSFSSSKEQWDVWLSHTTVKINNGSLGTWCTVSCKCIGGPSPCRPIDLLPFPGPQKPQLISHFVTITEYYRTCTSTVRRCRGPDDFTFEALFNPVGCVEAVWEMEGRLGSFFTLGSTAMPLLRIMAGWQPPPLRRDWCYTGLCRLRQYIASTLSFLNEDSIRFIAILLLFFSK